MEILTVAVGEFGHSVASAMKKQVRKPVIVELAEEVSVLPPTFALSAINVIISAKPVPALWRIVDEMCWKHNRFFIPVMLERVKLRIGPIFSYPDSPCWLCWELRELQRDNCLVNTALNDYYERSQRGPEGFLPALSRIAALRLDHTVDSLGREEKELRGQVWQFDFLNMAITANYLVPCEDCLRCKQRCNPSVETVEAIQAELIALWSE